MIIRNIRHKGLRRFVEEDDARGLPAEHVGKLRNMISFLQDMEREEELRQVAAWRAHRLTGDRRDTWSLHVSRNWRLTFRITALQIEILDLDFEDYH